MTPDFPRVSISRYAALAAAAFACACGFAFAGPSTEIEPNDTLPGTSPSTGPILPPGGTIQGSITPGDRDFIRFTVPGIDPPAEGLPTLSRRVFEVAANGDVVLDLIEPSTGRVLASSDDAPLAVAGGGPGSARCAFELLEASSTPTEWTVAVRGFWPDAGFNYEVRYIVEPVAPPLALALQPAAPVFVLDTVAPASSRWYALSLSDPGWLRVTLTPTGQFAPDVAFAVIDDSGATLAFADDATDLQVDYWQSPDSSLEGTVYIVVAPASVRTTLGVPAPAMGSEPPPLWDRDGVGPGEDAGWTLVTGPGGFDRVPGGSYRIDFEYGMPSGPCLADIDQNGGIDGGDLGAFFILFEAGDPAADLDLNGGVDGGDLAVFFEHFEAGC